MTARTRYVFLGAAGVVAVGFLAGLAAYFSGGMPAVAVAQERPDEFRYVPVDASIIGFADLRGLMASDLGEQLRGLKPNSQSSGWGEFQERTGIDVENDIDRLVAGLVPNGSDASHGIVLLTGRFNVARLESLARENGGTVSEYQGRRLITVSGKLNPGAESGSKQTSDLTMAFVEPGIIALGSDVVVRKAVDLPSDGNGVGGNEELMGLLSHIDDSSNAWTIGRLDDPGVEDWIPDQVGPQVLQVSAFAIGSRINGGVSGTITAETHDEAAGRNLHGLVQGFMALARMQTNSRPELTSLLNSLQLEAVGTILTLTFDLPSDLLLQLIPDDSGSDPADAN